MGIALGIDFSWIFIDFRRQVGAKLASKIDRKSMQKNIQKMMANKRPLKASLKRLGAVLADLEVSGGGGATKPAADFRSLNEKFEREEGRYRR